MATAARGTDNERDISVSDSLSNMSDELQEMFCEQCDKELETLVSAGGYCEKCLVYMCSTCLRYHKTYKPQHSIQDKTNMPQDFCFEKCQEHHRELIKFYCNSCKQKACTACKTRNHNNCIIAYIPTLVKSTNLENEVKELVHSIDNTLAINTNSIDEISSKCSEIEAVCDNATSSISKYKTKLETDITDLYHKSAFNLGKKHVKEHESFQNKRALKIAMLDREKVELIKKLQEKKENTIKNLDQQEKELLYKHQLENETLQDKQKQAIMEIERREKKLLDESENVVQEDKTRLKTLCVKAKTTKAQLENLKHDLCVKNTSNRKCEIFLAVRGAENQMEKLKTAAEEESQCGRINKYVFKASDEKLTKVETHISFGSLIEKSKLKRNISYNVYEDIKVTQGTDEKCSITGLCKISDTHLIAADNTNSSIKMIDTDIKEVKAVLQLESKPFDVTLVENNIVAATMPNARKINLISVTQNNEYSVSSQITVQGECYGIAFKKPNLIVGCKGNVQVLGIDGTVIETINVDKNVRDCNITRLHLNEDELYVLCNHLHYDFDSYLTLLEVSVDGKITEKQDSEQKLYGLFGSLTGDKEGTIFLASRKGDMIKQLSSDLKTSHSHYISERKCMFRTPKSMYEPPETFFYCNKENKLYAGTDKNIILVFNVS